MQQQQMKQGMMQQQQQQQQQQHTHSQFASDNENINPQLNAQPAKRAIQPMSFRAAPESSLTSAPVEQSTAEPVQEYDAKQQSEAVHKSKGAYKMSDFGGEVDLQMEALHDPRGRLNPDAVQVCKVHRNQK